MHHSKIFQTLKTTFQKTTRPSLKLTGKRESQNLRQRKNEKYTVLLLKSQNLNIRMQSVPINHGLLSFYTRLGNDLTLLLSLKRCPTYSTTEFLVVNFWNRDYVLL